MRRSTLATALVAVFLSYLGTPAPVKAGGYDETDLVANKLKLTDKNGIVHNADVIDQNLKNPWGVAESAGSPFWISDNNAGVATLYNVPGAKVSINPLVVRIPTPISSSGGAPTGLSLISLWEPGHSRLRMGSIRLRQFSSLQPRMERLSAGT